MDSQAGLQRLIPRAEIDSAVRRLAVTLTRDYREKNPVFIGILKGSFMFLADLVRQLDFPLEIEFVRLASYGAGRETSGKVRTLHGLRTPLRGRHVVVVEDIIDTGLTLATFIAMLEKKRPASLRLCALLDKPSRRRMPIKIDYLGLTVPDRFLVGYGLDCDEKFRNLPEIYCLEDKDGS